MQSFKIKPKRCTLEGKCLVVRRTCGMCGFAVFAIGWLKRVITYRATCCALIIMLWIFSICKSLCFMLSHQNYGNLLQILFARFRERNALSKQYLSIGTLAKNVFKTNRDKKKYILNNHFLSIHSVH